MVEIVWVFFLNLTKVYTKLTVKYKYFFLLSLYLQKTDAMGLTIQVKRSSTRQQLDKELERLSSKKKKLNLRKNMGKVRFQDIEPLELQKKLRDEWE